MAVLGGSAVGSGSLGRLAGGAAGVHGQEVLPGPARPRRRTPHVDGGGGAAELAPHQVGQGLGTAQLADEGGPL